MIFFTLIALLLIFQLISPKTRSIHNYGYLVFAVILVALLGLVLSLSFIAMSPVGHIENTFFSDEILYINASEFSPLGGARGGWYSLNYVLINYDFLSYYALRLVNVVFAGFVLVYVARIFCDGRLALFLLLLCPYIFAMTYFNLRDLSIIMAVLIVTDGFHRKAYVSILIGFLLLFTLRPLMVVVYVSIYTILYFLSGSGKFRAKSVHHVVILVLLFAILALFSHQYVEQYISYMEYLSRSDSEHRTILVDEGGSFILAFLTYVFTPIPTSLVERLLYIGVTDYGLFHDIVRIINQFCLYALIGLGLLSGKSFFLRSRAIFRLLSLEQKALIIYLLLHSVIYAIHLGGIGHSRLKIPFQAGYFIIFYLCFLRFKKSQRQVLF